MANPSPQHTPTDGLGVAAYVHVAGTGVTADLTVGANKPNPGKYNLTLSLGGTSTCQLTTTLVDVSNTSYTAVGTPVYVSYGDPNNAAGSPPAWYKPSAFAGYTAEIVSVSSSGLITARGIGESIVEVAFPTFDNTLGNGPSDINEAEPVNMIYAQIRVIVTA